MLLRKTLDRGRCLVAMDLRLSRNPVFRPGLWMIIRMLAFAGMLVSVERNVLVILVEALLIGGMGTICAALLAPTSSDVL